MTDTFRLASRSVIGLYDGAADVESAILDLAQQGVRPVDVSVLAQSEALDKKPATHRGKGVLAKLGKASSWLPEGRTLESPAAGSLVGVGALATVLAQSPRTSSSGALVMQGIPLRDAKAYVDAISASQIVVLVGVADHTAAERVRTILGKHGASLVDYFAGRPYGTAYHGVGPGLR